MSRLDDIVKVEACGDVGYYITYRDGRKDYVSIKRIRIQEELGIGSMTREDYKRIMKGGEDGK